MIVSGVTKTPADVALYAKCTLLATTLSQSSDDTYEPCRPDNAIESCIEFLVDNEFILLQEQDGEDGKHGITVCSQNLITRFCCVHEMIKMPSHFNALEVDKLYI